MIGISFGFWVLGFGFIPRAQADLNQGLLAHWKFDEGSGSVANDSYGNGNTGVLSGNGDGYTQWQAGKIGVGALLFDEVIPLAAPYSSTGTINAPPISSSTIVTIPSWNRSL